MKHFPVLKPVAYYPWLFIALLLCVLLYYRTWLTIIAEWQFNGGFGHGYLVVGFSAYLFYTSASLPSAPIHTISRYLSLLIIAICSVVWVLSSIAWVVTVEQLAWLGIVYGLVLGYLGFRWCLKHWIPLLMPLLAVPFWSYLVQPLRDLSTYVSFEVLTLLGQWLEFSLERDGYLISLKEGRFLVEDSCSGLSFFLTALFISLAFIAMHRVRWPKALLALCICIGLALLSNWIRIVLIILAGQFYSMEHPIVADHLTFGWVVFGACLLPMIAILRSLSPKETSNHNEVTQPVARSVASPSLFYRLTSIILIIAPLGIYAYLNQPPNQTYKPSYFAALQPAITSTFWRPSFVGADVEKKTYLLIDGQEIEVYMAYYETEKANKELIFVENQPYGEKFWFSQHNESIEIPELGTVSYEQLSNGIHQATLLYWYDVGGRVVSNGMDAKQVSLKQRIQRKSGSLYLALGLKGDLGSKEKNQAVLTKAAIELLNR